MAEKKKGILMELGAPRLVFTKEKTRVGVFYIRDTQFSNWAWMRAVSIGPRWPWLRWISNFVNLD